MVYDPNNPEMRSQFERGFIRGVETDPRFPRYPDTVEQEYFMLDKIGDAVERQLMTGIQGEELYLGWVDRRKVDVTRVRHVSEPIDGRFFE